MSDMLYNFGQMANKGNPLTNLGGQFADMVNTKRAAEAARVANERYQEALTAYNANPRDEEAYSNYMDAADGVGKFDLAKESVKGMDAIYQKNGLTRIMKPYAALYSGNNEAAITQLEEDSLADPSGKKHNDFLIQQIKEGNSDSALQYLGAMASLFEGGKDAMGNIYNMNKDKRDETLAMTDFIERGAGLVYTSPEHENRVLSGANKMKDSILARLFAEMGSVVGGDGSGSLTGESLADYVWKTNKEYTTRIKNYKTVVDSADNIFAAAQPNSGFSDDAILKLFNKVLDPDSVVRQSELEATLAAQGKLEEFKNLIPKWGTGVTLNAVTRPKLLEIVRILKEEAEGNILTVQEDFNPLVDRFIGERPEDHALIYGPGKDKKEDVVKDPLADVRAMLLKKYPDYEDIITNGTPEELQEAFKTTLEADGIDLIGTPATATTEDPVTSGTPFQEFVIKRNKLTGRAADNVRNMSDERLMEGNPGTASAWKAQQDAPAETELAPKIPDQPIQAEIRSKILNKARLQGNAGTQMYKDIQTMSIQELEKKYPELYKEFSTPADVWEF